MNESTTDNGILRCVRCKSSDEIKQYSHKSSDKHIEQGKRSSTKIIYSLAIGGKGDVPVCSRCYRKFTYWKVMFPLLFIFLIISSLVFMIPLVANLIEIFIYYTPPIMEYLPRPTDIDIIFNIVSGIITLILAISFILMNWVLNTNPSKVITIRGKRIYIKPRKAYAWRFYGNTRIKNSNIQEKKADFEFPDKCSFCLTDVIQVDENVMICPECNALFSYKAE